MKRLGYWSLPLALALQATVGAAEFASEWERIVPAEAAEQSPSPSDWAQPPTPPAPPQTMAAYASSANFGHYPSLATGGCAGLGFGACCERQYSPLDGLWANYCQERPRRHPASIFFGALHIDRRRWSCCPGPCGECDGHAASMGPVPTHALPESHLPMAPSSETDAHPADAPPQEAGPVEELPSEDPPIEVTPPEVPEEAPGAWLPIPRSNRRPR